MTDSPGTTQVIERYFALAETSDIEAFLAQFSGDAVVSDDGHRRVGTNALREWRTTVPQVTYRLRHVEPTRGGGRAVAEIAGDFPGSPVDLAFAFTLDGAMIRELTISPVTA